PAPAAGGLSASSSWVPGGGLSDATFDGVESEVVWGELADIGFSTGVGGLSDCPNGDPSSLNFSLGFFGGKYQGVQVNFKGGHFDGITIGLGLGVALPVTYTTTTTHKK